MKISSRYEHTEANRLRDADDCIGQAGSCTQQTLSDKSDLSAQRKLAAFTRELVSIKAQCDIGIEPVISIASACFLSKRSHASIYRDIKKRILPSPVKIGRNSALPFSVVKAYAAGQLNGGRV